MAIKGLIDNQAYVLGDYQTPIGYFNPARSVGDYILDDYAVKDYFFEGLELSSTFSVSAAGTTDFTGANLVASFTVSASAEKFDFASGSIASSFGISVSPTRIRTGAGSTSAAFSSSQQGNATFLSSASVDTTIQQTTNGSYTAGSGTLNLIGFYTQTQIAGELFFGEPPDITWDSFRESEFIDRSWDEWFGDAWDQGGVFFSVSSIFKATGGYLAQASATLQPSFTQSQNITIIVTKDLSVSASQQVDGNYTANTGTSVISQTTKSSDAIRFRGVAIDGTPLDIQPVSTQSTNANYNADLGYQQTNTGVFATQAVGSAVFDQLGLSFETAFAQASLGSAIFDPTLAFSAFNTQLSAGRLITIADPFNIFKIRPEARVLVLPEDSRVIKVLQETRLNTLATETRDLIVNQETRDYKIFRPGFTNRTSTPKVRSET